MRADYAAVPGPSRRVRATVTPARRGAADRRVKGVQHVHVWVGREVWVDCQPKQTAIRIAINFGAQVGEGGGRSVREVIEDFDHAALLGDEDASIFGELHVGGSAQAAEDNRFLKPRGQRGHSVCLEGAQQCEEDRSQNRRAQHRPQPVQWGHRSYNLTHRHRSPFPSTMYTFAKTKAKSATARRVAGCTTGFPRSLVPPSE